MPETPTERIGIYGGTFDPPHRGHLKVARAAKEALRLDEVIFLPAARNPMKTGRATASGPERMEMVKLLISGQPGFSVSDMELTRGGVSYTVDTLGELQMVRPADYWFLMGADALKGFDDWKNPARILRLCRAAVVTRPPLSADDVRARFPAAYRERFDVVPMPADLSSSTAVKDALHMGKPTPELTPEVLRYIQKHRLYKR